MSASSRAETQARAVAGPQQAVGGRDCWACCPAWGLLCCSPPVKQCLGLSGVFGSWLVTPVSELVPIVRLDPKVTLPTLRSGSLTLMQQSHGLSWEPIFFPRRGQSELGWERRRWHNGRSQSCCCEKTNKALKNTQQYTDSAVAMLAGGRPEHHTTVLSPASVPKNLPYYSSSGLSESQAQNLQLLFLSVETKANRLSQKC